MIMTYENLLRLSDFQWKACSRLRSLNAFHFLSFQDALHYLIKAYDLKGKKILVPAFYCEATIKDMEMHGLRVGLCQIDYRNFDVDVADFKAKLQSEQPDIIVIYNFFGKNSLLYADREWRRDLKPDAILISDFAHSLLPNHTIEFLNDRHFYIDSTRKTTHQMMAHLIMPAEMSINTNFVVRYSLFKLAIRTLFFLKSGCLRLATRFNIKIFSDLGMWFYLRHDKYIGSPKEAFTGSWWDGFLYKHINFEKIRSHRRLLYREYQQHLKRLVQQGYLEVFDIPAKEEENICFFFVRIVQAKHIAPVLQRLQENGFWAEVLWDFDAIKDISPNDRDWAKSIVVLPYTVGTQPRHIYSMAFLMEAFFNTHSPDVVPS